MQGIYAGISYVATEKDGKNYVGLQADAVAHFIELGADLTILDDIGDKNPDDAMADLFDSIPKKEDSSD